jgi:hypothetical protein
MAGRKGQKNPSKHKRENQWTKGTAEVIREPEVFAFKVSKELYPRVKAEIEERGISKQQFVDGLLACYYDDDEGEAIEGDFVQNEGQREVKSELSPLVRDAIATSIEIKQAALRSEKKSKRPNQGLIEKWESQIEELENLLRD